MKKLITFSAIILLAAGCNKMESPALHEDGLMEFNIEYPATKATESAFEAGDKIGLYITEYVGDKPSPLQLGGNFKNNIPVSFNGTKWTASPAVYWGTGKYDVFAYYPYMIPESVDELPFKVALDQNVAETATSLSAYEASDFLYASEKGLTSANGAVNLLFKHKMSKFSVKIEKGEYFEGDIPSEMTVLIHNTVTDCLIDLSTGDVVKNPLGTTNTIKAKRISSNRYSAIIVPQMLTNKKPLVEIIFKDVSYMIDSKFQFKSGVHHTLNITLNNNPDKVKIEIGGEIESDWQ